MIPFLDLAALHRPLREELMAALGRTLDSSAFTLGPEVAGFEAEFAAYVGVRHAVGVNSGTSALHLALLAAGVGPGDEVITVPMTFVATVAAIVLAGARPRLVDVDPVTWTMDPAALAAAIGPNTRAVLPVHLHGQTADMPAILDIARRHGLAVIEDAAQAHGALDHGRGAGSLGTMGCFSFYPGKNLGACGEAGAVVTDDDALAERLRMLRDWGQREKYRHELKGFNCRMEGFQGAVLRIKLRHLDAWNDARRQVAALYDAGLPPHLGRPGEASRRRHVYHVYAVRSPRREHLRAALERRGIASAIHYPHPIHLLPAYRDLGYAPGDFPVSERLAEEFLSLPIWPGMTADQVEAVCTALREAGDDG